ncbi:hypothetical protein GCM10010129_77160 [Streptomyces fumigatiscleroticus]|nr:hypothetical protein GCM10010129_77160 [Streptomyces fumigatiscleroticus]
MADTPDYDAAAITIDPHEVDEIGKSLLNLAQNVGDAIEGIANASFHLTLGWAGRTASEAKAFGDRWEAVMRELFGSEKNPDEGVLNVMAGTVHGVAVVYSQTEMKIEQTFHDFASGLAGGGDTTTPTSPPPDAPAGLDPQDSAVLEDFPN